MILFVLIIFGLATVRTAVKLYFSIKRNYYFSDILANVILFITTSIAYFWLLIHFKYIDL